ncbi:hypothetical protein TNCT_467831 [Trichonephila clavata]|uniref:Uncharacterized protein n=1 Tax=Trichonephila clavata TaxID=2740835 RepID=A0A8X6J3B9_TRICU|nr:hypothetical protein TNCT_467831 [Trichonephila clavata]
MLLECPRGSTKGSRAILEAKDEARRMSPGSKIPSILDGNHLLKEPFVKLNDVFVYHRYFPSHVSFVIARMHFKAKENLFTIF